MKTPAFLSKKESLALYGIAILLMLFHHLFCSPDNIPYHYICLFGNINVITSIAWFCKICVGMFAFLSGYGLCLASTGAEALTPLQKLRTDYVIALKHMWRFYKKYGLVIIIFVLGKDILKGHHTSLMHYFRLFWGDTSHVSGEWWYVGFYLTILFIFPIINYIITSIYERRIIRCSISILLLVVICVLCVNILKKPVVYYIIFIEGYLIAKFGLFTVIHTKLPNQKVQILTSGGGLFLVIALRLLLSTEAGWATGDFILVPIWIYSLTSFLHIAQEKMMQIMIFIGKYSTYMWLTHTFFAYYYFQKYVYFPKYVFLIYLWLIILSLITSFVLDKIYYLIAFMLQKIHSISSLTSKS